MIPFHAFHLPMPQYQPPIEPLIWIVNPSSLDIDEKNPWSPKNPSWALHDSHGPHVALYLAQGLHATLERSFFSKQGPYPVSQCVGC
ncbi:hypothetical protein BDR04DRAFT_1093738 [Suillus decipiens]|nr:hypothetical protein BDR04DRAFT_1093738 [Suillus decipiens]